MGKKRSQWIRYVVCAAWCFIGLLALPACSPMYADCTGMSVCREFGDDPGWCAGSGSCTYGVYPGYCMITCDPAVTCATNVGCGSCSDNGGNTLVQSWTCPAGSDCTKRMDTQLCSENSAPTCVNVPLCNQTCHPTVCTNVTGILGCITVANPTGAASYNDCMVAGEYICGTCDGVLPTSAPVPTSPPAPTNTPAPGTLTALSLIHI